MTQHTYGVLFAGLGGLSRGFQDAGMRQAFAIDFDAAACRDHETICGEPATLGDLATMSPEQLRALSPRRPDVLVSSPPCVAFSGCLPIAQSITPEYQAISSLAFRGIWLALEAWQDSPPPLILIENVPRIQSRGREWLDDLAALFESYGYAWRETTHDCGELGGLAQHRRRFLGVARHRSQVPEFLYQPPVQRVRGVGEVLESLPVPVPRGIEGGPMHKLGRLSLLNWCRLALIPAGGDWRDLPQSVALTCSPRTGVYGVHGWSGSCGTVVGEARIDNGTWAIADPRSMCKRPFTALGVTAWAQATHAVIGAARSCQGASFADPRMPIISLAGATPLPSLADKSPIHAVIEAGDGTWHRPMTTMELFALQGFEPGDETGGWLVLDGKSERGWRKRIGNAVPPPAAKAVAASCIRTLIACAAGGLLLSGERVWVKGRFDLDARWS